MSFLDSITPKKNMDELSITVFEEDRALFESALNFLKSKHKGSSEFSSEGLFEHLLSPLRADKELMEYINSGGSRRGRRALKKNSSEQVCTGVTQ